MAKKTIEYMKRNKTTHTIFFVTEDKTEMRERKPLGTFRFVEYVLKHPSECSEIKTCYNGTKSI